MTPETTFKIEIKKWLDEEGFYHIPYAASRFSKRGVPDTLMCINGIFVAIEFKVDKGDYGAKSKGLPTELQKYHLNKIIEEGGVSILLYPRDAETFKVLLVEFRDKSKEYTKRGIPSNLLGKKLKKLGEKEKCLK